MNEQNYNINIEKSVLSSIIFEPSQFDELSSLLKKDDFYLPAHQDIYGAISALVAQDKPIDEEFIAKELRRSKRFDETAMLDILAANPVAPANIFSYIKEIRADSINRQIYQYSLDLQHKFDLKTIDKLQELKDRLSEVGGQKRLKKLTENASFWGKIDMAPEEIENLRFEYLYPNFIVKNEITMIAARPSSGKSLTTVALSNIFLSNKTIDTVIYLDGDNGKSTLKERNIHGLKRRLAERLKYIQGHSRETMSRVVRELKSSDLTGCMVVFDSIKNFMDGGDRDKNKDVSKVMDVLKALRNNGATVIFLHHSNKPQKDINELMYAGSSAWEEDTGNAYILKRNEDKGTFIFHNIKKRTGDLYDMAFTYDAASHWLCQADISEAKQTKEDEEMINETIEYLKSSRNKPMWSELWKNLTDLGYDKEKASKIIKNNEGKLWNFERGDRNNQKHYFLIETQSKVKETVYEDLAPRTPITPRTPVQGSFESSDICMDDSDNSENSQNRQNSSILVPRTPRTPDLGLCKGLDVVSDKSDNSENPKIPNNIFIAKDLGKNFPIDMPTL